MRSLMVICMAVLVAGCAGQTGSSSPEAGANASGEDLCRNARREVDVWCRQGRAEEREASGNFQCLDARMRVEEHCR